MLSKHRSILCIVVPLSADVHVLEKSILHLLQGMRTRRLLFGLAGKGPPWAPDCKAVNVLFACSTGSTWATDTISNVSAVQTVEPSYDSDAVA